MEIEMCAPQIQQSISETKKEVQRERERNEKQKNVKKDPFICSKERSGGAIGERHSTCRHMASMAHHPNPVEYYKLLVHSNNKGPLNVMQT